MELRQIRYFVAVAESLHFGNAARKIGITQPALSQQIRQLELELDGQLFFRTKQHVQLSEAGKVFYQQARILLNQCDLAISTTKNSLSGTFGTIKIGFVESATIEILPQIVKHYHTIFPEVNVSLMHAHTEKQIKLLESDQLDVGIMGFPPNIDSLDYYSIRTEPYWVALSIGHKFRDRETIDIRELKTEKFILTNREVGAVYYDKVIQVCMEAGFSPQVCQQADEMQTILSIVSCGMGIALIHESAKNIRNDILYKPIVNTKHIAYIPSFVWKKDCSPLVKKFLDLSISLF